MIHMTIIKATNSIIIRLKKSGKGLHEKRKSDKKTSNGIQRVKKMENLTDAGSIPLNPLLIVIIPLIHYLVIIVLCV